MYTIGGARRVYEGAGSRAAYTRQDQTATGLMTYLILLHTKALVVERRICDKIKQLQVALHALLGLFARITRFICTHY
jgi:hypothetical protein